MKFVAYYRVSTAEQGRSGLGLDAQRTAVSTFLAARPGAELVGSHEEVVSGKRDDRPALALAMRRCRLTGATLLVAKLDRLSRSMRFLAELREGDVPFVAADLPDANTLTLGVMSAMAQHEREVISARTRAGLAAARARGVVLGGPNLDRDRNTDTRAARAEHLRRAGARNAQLAEIVAEIEAAAGEPMTLQRIADELNAAGYTTARGKAFTRAAVRRVRLAAETAADAA